VIAHRCRGYGTPDQSPQAIAAALRNGAHVHLAAYLSADGKWVVPRLSGLSDERAARRAHTTTAARLDALPLEHALALVAAHAPNGPRQMLYLEAKDTGNERALVAALTRLDMLDRTVLLAWEPEVLRRAHGLAPSLFLGLAFVPLGHAVARSRAVTHREYPRRKVRLAFDPAQSFDALPGIGKTPVRTLADVSLPLSCVCIPAVLCRSRTIAAARSRGARVVAYGVYNNLLLRVLRRRGVDAILTNHALTLTGC